MLTTLSGQRRHLQRPAARVDLLAAVMRGPTSATASTMIAKIVVATMPMSSPPLTLRTTSTLISSRPKTNTRIGQPASWPLTPKLISGTLPGRG